MKTLESAVLAVILCDYTCALFHGDIFDIFRLGKPLQVGLHPPPWA
jgi:hypothetical protein